MTAVSDGSPPPLRGLVDAALSAACDALAVAEEAEQVKRVLRALARALLRSKMSPTAPTSEAANGGGDAADPSAAPKRTTAGSKAAEEACAAAETSISALEEFLTKEEGKKGGDEAAAAAAETAAARSRLALSLSFAPLADALLSLVAPDWLRDSFSADESRELFDAFFLGGRGAGAAEALEACCDHLGSVVPISDGGDGAASFLPFGPSSSFPSSPSSAIAAAPGARAAARLLASRFVEGEGVRELLLDEAKKCEEGGSAAAADAAAARAERLAAALASCPDRAAAAGCVDLLEGSAAARSFARQAVEAVAEAAMAAPAAAAAAAAASSSSPHSSVAAAAALLLTRLARRGMGTAAAFGAFRAAEAAAAAAAAAKAAKAAESSLPPLGEVLSRVEDGAAAEALLRGLLLCCCSDDAPSFSSSSSPSSPFSLERARRAAASLVELAGPRALSAPAALFALSDKFLTGSRSAPLPPRAAAVVAPLLASLEAGRGNEGKEGKALQPQPMPPLESSLLPRALADAARAWAAPGAALGTQPHVAGYASAQLVAGLAVLREALLLPQPRSPRGEGKEKGKEESKKGAAAAGASSLDDKAPPLDPSFFLDACAPGLVPALLSGVGARLDSPLDAHRAQAMRVGGALASVLNVGVGGGEGKEGGSSPASPFALFEGCGDLGLSPEERWSSDCGPGSWRLFSSGNEAAGGSTAAAEEGQSSNRNRSQQQQRRQLQSPLADSDDEFVAPRTLARETPGTVSDWRAEAEKQKKRAGKEGAGATAALPAPPPSSSSSKPKTKKGRSPFSFRFDLAPRKPPRDPEALDLVSAHAEGAPTAAQRAAGVAAGLDSGRGRPAQLRDAAAALRKADADPGGAVAAVAAARALLASRPAELRASAAELAGALLQARLPEWADDEEGTPSISPSSIPPLPATAARAAALIDLVALEPEAAGSELAKLIYSPHLDTHQRLLALDAFSGAARVLAAGGGGLLLGGGAELAGGSEAPRGLPSPNSSSSSSAVAAAGGAGKSRVWGSAVKGGPTSSAAAPSATAAAANRNRNLFLPHAVPWATALLAECDVERHGVDLFGRDALLLGRLMTTLAGFVGCAASATASPGESVGVAAPLAAALLELASSPDVRRSPSPYVRRCALASAASVAGALPPTALLGDGGGGGGGGTVVAAEKGGTQSSSAPWERRLQSALDAAAAHAAAAAASDADPNVRLLAGAARGAFSALATRTLELRVRRDLLSDGGGGGGGGGGLGLASEGPRSLAGAGTRIRLPPSNSSSSSSAWGS